MINKQRVHRIKNLIYALMILVLLLPVILMVILSFKILDTNREIIRRLDGINSPVSQSAATSSPSSESAPPNGGFVIEPENQLSTPEQELKDAAPGSNEISLVGNSDTGSDVDLYLGRDDINKGSQNIIEPPASESESTSGSREVQSTGGSGSAGVGVKANDINAGGVGMQSSASGSAGGSLGGNGTDDVDISNGSENNRNSTVIDNQVIDNQNAHNPTTGINNNPQTGR